MTAVEIAPLPVADTVVNPPRNSADAIAWKITSPWLEYLTRLQGIVQSCLRKINGVTLVEQSASISATDFSGGGLAAGLYEISYYVRVTQAAGTSSEIQVTFDWVDGAVVVTRNSANLTGNTTVTYTSESLPIRIDKNSAVRYSTTYVSVGSPVMKYRLDLTLKQLPQ
jgi:hypothetical protein